MIVLTNTTVLGFPGGSVEKSPPANDPWPGKTPQATEQRGPGTISAEPALWSPEPHLRPCSRSRCPTTREAATARSPGLATGGEPHRCSARKPGQQWRSSTAKLIKILNYIKDFITSIKRHLTPCKEFFKCLLFWTTSPKTSTWREDRTVASLTCILHQINLPLT